MEPKPNQLVTCPFNPAHRIEHFRFQVHLTKCQKQHPKMHISSCPFDATHFVKSEELNHHVVNCPQRGMLDSRVYVTDDDHRPPVEVHVAEQNFESSENWDADNVQTYNPREVKRTVPIYNKIKGATKSERSKFRHESSLQYAQALHQQQQPQQQQSSSSQQDQQRPQ